MAFQNSSVPNIYWTFFALQIYHVFVVPRALVYTFSHRLWVTLIAFGV